MYNFQFQVSDDDLTFAKSLEASWGDLYQTSIFRGKTLEQTKEKFSKLNVAEISKFLIELDEFIEKFDREGPGTVGEDLDRGLLLMEVLSLYYYHSLKISYYDLF